MLSLLVLESAWLLLVVSLSLSGSIRQHLLWSQCSLPTILASVDHDQGLEQAPTGVRDGTRRLMVEVKSFDMLD